MTTSVENHSKSTRKSGLAIASFVFSILSFGLGPLGCIPGIICGHLAKSEIRRDSTLQGSGLAQAGIIMGYVFLGLFAIFIPSMIIFYFILH